VAPEDARNIVVFTHSLQDKLVTWAVQAFVPARARARLSWGSGVAHFAIGTGASLLPGASFWAVTRAAAWTAVFPVLRVDSADGKLRAVLFDYACHKHALTPNHFRPLRRLRGICAAYIQERFPGAAKRLFMIGCGLRRQSVSARHDGKRAPKLGATLGREVAPHFGMLRCGR